MADTVEARGRAVMQEMFGSPGGPSTGFRGPFEDLVARYCFGETWGRDELIPRKMRSMLTLAILAGASKPNQFRVHVKGAIANGVSVEEIQEVLLHDLPVSGDIKGMTEHIFGLIDGNLKAGQGKQA